MFRTPNAAPLWWIFALLIATITMAACDPMAPTPPSVAIVISPEPTVSLTPAATNTRFPSPTPLPSPTPDIAPTATPFPCDVDEGQIIEFQQFRSPTANENLRYRVYVPPCYFETQARFPYVILLHGLSFREQQWEDIGAIEALDQGIRLGALPPMILVMPYYGQIGQFNQFPPDPSYETVILEELIPAVEADFCTWEDRDYRGIGGISRGAFWAYSIGLRHPDIFSRVGGHSAIFPENLNVVPPQFNPLNLAENSSFLVEADMKLYMDNAVSDSAGQSLQQLSNRLTERQIPHQYQINTSGNHDNEYWSAHVQEYLSFYGQDWPRGYEGLPSCLEPSP
jgi:enterochelin esterase-like enzyme